MIVDNAIKLTIIVAERSYWDNTPYANKRLTVPPSAKAKSVQLKIIQKDFCYTRYTRCTSWFPRTKDSA